MWKYVSRRIRDTFERSASYFDKRSATGLTNTPNNSYNEKEKCSFTPCCWKPAYCWNSFQSGSNTNNKRWNFEQLNGTWLGAITWSSALVLGWYASQLIHLKYKYKSRRDKEEKRCIAPTVLQYLKPYVSFVNSKKALLRQSTAQVDNVISEFTPTVYLISNDHSKGREPRVSTDSGNSSDSDHSEHDLGEVLNSIENRLGLAAIENGQHQDGLNLLRSAANRKHAPALYNLALCYEMGLGVPVDEKMAMELYRSAAALEHVNAMYNLGIYYGQGRGGLSRDLGTARRLLRLAAFKGSQNAISALKTLDMDMTEPHTPPQADEPVFTYTPYAHKENIAPTHSALFSAINTAICEQKCEYAL